MMIPYFHLPYFHVSNSVFFTSVLSFYTDVVLTLSMTSLFMSNTGHGAGNKSDGKSFMSRYTPSM